MYDVAVVGAAGFLGRAICRALNQAGTITHEFTREHKLLDYLDDTPAGNGHRTPKFAALIWAAGAINPRLAVEQPHLVAQEQAEFTATVAAVLRHAPTIRIVLLSSGGTVYGPPASLPYQEHATPAPVNAYGHARLAMEQQLLALHSNTVVLRVANAYGPGQVPAPGQGVVAHWLHAINEGRPVTMYGSPNATRDYVFVEDVAQAVRLAIQGDATGVLNVGGGRSYALQEVLDLVRQVVAPAPVFVHQAAGRDTDADHSYLDITKIGTALGWSPEVDLPAGLNLTWQALASQQRE